MNNDAELERVERMLSRTPRPDPVPAGLESVARAAALGEPPARGPVIPSRPAHPRRRLRMPDWWRVASASAALGAAATAAVAIAIGGSGGGFTAERSLALSGPAGAHGTVELAAPSHGVRAMEISVHDLRPAGRGHYYEMWFRTGGDTVSAITFDTAAGGSATVHAVIPASMSWRSCWVTRETIGHEGSATTVLHT